MLASIHYLASTGQGNQPDLYQVAGKLMSEIAPYHFKEMVNVHVKGVAWLLKVRVSLRL